MATTRLTWRLNRALKKALVATGKRLPGVMSAMRFGVWARRKLEFARLRSGNPVDGSVVVFECYGGRGYSCSPRALYRALVAQRPGCDRELVWAFRGEIVAALAERGGYDIRGMEGFYTGMRFRGTLERVFGEQALEELRDAVIVPYGSREYYRTYARAGTWISNFIIPTHLTPGPGQTYVQTWHGTPLKRLGCDIPAGTSNAMFSVRDIHRRYRSEGKRLTHFISPSRFATERFITAFDLEALGKADAIIEEGYPRNDVLSTFTAEQAAAVRARLGLPSDKKLVLYAPTWRDDQHVSGLGYTLDLGVDFDHLRQALGDEYAVLFRAHYLIANQFDFSRYEGFIYDVSEVNDINDLYIVGDLLITDYSSVFFDYANLDRPIIFHMYDLDRYAEGLRGFYLGLDELPGPVVKQESELIEAIRAAGEQSGPDPRLTAFRARFTYLDDGRASERTLAKVRGMDRACGRREGDVTS